ncbi:MAG: protein kinase, partial [Actinobacteria bacterium]|nr:protein kinase [Actinomycetota bacterium]
GEVAGTIAYMAPETLVGEPATPLSDVYSLGAVAYQMLAGRPPFEADNIGTLINRIREEPPAPLGPEVPPELAGGVLRSLDKDPARRPESAGALATSLLTATTLPMEAPVPTQPIAAGPVASRSAEPTVVYATDKGARRRPWDGFTIPLLLLIALALVIAVFALVPDGREAAPAATAPTTTTPTTTTVPTTTTTPTTTTLSPDSPEAISAGIYQLLDEMRPPEFKPKEIKDIREGLDKIIEEAAEGDREELGESLEEVFDKIDDLPESEERQRLFDEFVRLAESYGFTVSEREEEGD